MPSGSSQQALKIRAIHTDGLSCIPPPCSSLPQSCFMPERFALYLHTAPQRLLRYICLLCWPETTAISWNGLNCPFLVSICGHIWRWGFGRFPANWLAADFWIDNCPLWLSHSSLGDIFKVLLSSTLLIGIWWELDKLFKVPFSW
jgi:hypothetical protein